MAAPLTASVVQLLASVKAPINNEKVYKDECMFSFDRPDSEDGLYICMHRFYGFGKRYVGVYSRRTGQRVFLHLKRVTRILAQPESEPERKKPTKLAIGVEGGFDLNEPKYTIEEKNSIVILPDWTEIPLPCEKLPGQTQLSVAAIIAAESASKAEELAALSSTWDGEQRVVSRFASSLEQLDNGKKIPPSGWKCEMCDLTTPLWLNLTDGSILCGRRYFDGTGGNNHALDRYHQTNYKLAVKLGTITPEGADVYSYPEDDMVLDPLLAQHLAHFGIDIMKMKQTEKTMAELEIDLNNNMGEWDIIQESGTELTPLSGPGFTGMRNLGNSCYMNSVVQVLFSIQSFVDKYVTPAEQYFDAVTLDNIQSSFNAQMAKLGRGLLSGDYSKERPKDTDVVYPLGISPNSFKQLVGRGHPDFSSKKQQDVHEYLLHLFSLITRNSYGSENPLDDIRFYIEERVLCTASKCVRYVESENFVLSLPVPLHAAQNMDEFKAFELWKKDLEKEGKRITDPKDVVRLRISLKSCLEAFSSTEFIENFYSTASRTTTTAAQCARLKTFPPYLFIHVKKFTTSDNWVPKKLDVSIDVPETLDINYLRGHGRQPDEKDFPADDVAVPGAAVPAPAFQLDEDLVAQLMDTGFHMEGCKRAVFHTKNAGLEPAMNWILEHMADADFELPFNLPTMGGKQEAAPELFVPNEEGLEMLMAMGFTKQQATTALKSTDNNLERAADWIFSHAAELDEPVAMDTQQATPQAGTFGVPPKPLRDCSGNYRLKAFISHMGTSSDVGHYVCHIKKGENWVIYNDEKVALSQHPPKDLAYMYLYESIELEQPDISE